MTTDMVLLSVARSTFHRFVSSESAGGFALMAAAAVAMLIANSPLGAGYLALLHLPLGALRLEGWINDGLMAIFFLLVGLEIKREMVGGALATWRARFAPGVAALGGMAVPALIYVAFNTGEGGHMRGWAIPAATDIAFALAAISLLGSRVPVSLKLFLTALAILDDLGAILIIALFYTDGIVWMALAGAALILFIMIVLNRLHVMPLWPYLLLTIGLWWFMQQSGVHATVAGVAAAMTIPARRWPSTGDEEDTPLHRLEHALQPWVAFLVLPVFGLANAGVSFAGMGLADLAAPPPVGVALGLFLGKQIGVFGAFWLAARLGAVSRPEGATWLQVYGVSVLCGIGFTMSLFIGLLAFPAQSDAIKLAIVLGSVLSAVAGVTVLALAARGKTAT
jgi:NhaA family Na+:H+ antiporter